MTENRSLRLETERLILRDFVEEDWQDVHEYGSDPEVVKFMPFGPNTEQDTRNFLQGVIAHQKENPRQDFNFALIVKSSHKLIGACAISIRNAENREGELGYILNRHFWRQGYMTEAAGKAIEFGFEHLKLHRIFANCDPANTGSYRVMEKNGMQREGCLRKHRLFKGVWRDFLLYAILEDEWHTLKESRLNEHGRRKNINLEFVETSGEGLDLIEPLWEKLIEHHKAVSIHFRNHFSTISFNLRKKELLEKSREGALFVDLVKDRNSGRFIGYCVTSVNAEKQGEIDSIYVEESYRGAGIGNRLMVRALDWQGAMSVKKTILGVAHGNENVFGFYRRYHFFPRVTILERKPSL